MLHCESGSTEEMRLEALLLERILNQGANDAGAARAVAQAEARRIYCLALLLIDQLHDARNLFASALLGGIDPDLRDHVLGIADPFGMTIARELLAWRDAIRDLSVMRPR